MSTSLLRRAARTLAPAVALCIFAFQALADGVPDVAHLAPARSFLVVTIPDFAQFRGSFEKSDLGALWREPAVQSLIEELAKDTSKEFADFLQEVGIKKEDLKAPTGQVGFAMFQPEHAPDTKDGKTPEPELLIVADMGPNADSWQDSLDRLIDRGVKDKKITSDEDTYAGSKVTTIKPAGEGKKHDDAKRENGQEDDEQGAMEDEADQTFLQGLLRGPLSARKEIHITRSGSVFMISTEKKAMEAAIDAAAGKGGESLADAQAYRDALGQHPSGALGHAVFLTAPLVDMLREGEAKGAAPDAPNTEAILGALGITGVKAVSAGIRMDTPDSMVEVSLGVLAPEKKGLLSLFTQPLGQFDPPGFVPPDAASVTRLSFKFDGVFDVLRSVAAAMPEKERDQFNQQLDMGANLVKPALDAAGPAIHSFTAYKQPLGADSELSTFAIDLRDQGTVSNVLLTLSGQMHFFEPRDFEGNTIYTSEFMPIAVGLGFNRLFVGPAAAVENSMRLAGRADAPRISSEPAFKEATRSFSDDAVASSFADIRQTIRWEYWVFQNQEKILEDQLAQAQIPEEARAEYLKSMREHRPEWQDHLPPLETVVGHLGDMASELRPTADGFRGRMIMLKPSAK